MASGTQLITTRILRLFFIPDNQLGQIDQLKEAEFLLDPLVDHRCPDLDVLVDTYLLIEMGINDTQKASYLTFFEEIYFSEKQFIGEQFSSLKEGYESSQDNKQLAYLHMGKSLENKNNAVRYMNDLLKIENINN